LSSNYKIPVAPKIKDITTDINGKPIIYFQRDSDLRSYKTKTLPFTQAHIEELVKCSKDIVYFAENYVWINTLDFGDKKITLREYQRKHLRSLVLHNKHIFLQSRQTGKSVIMAIFAIWSIIFHPTSITIMAHEGAAAKNILDKIKLAYRHLPMFMKPGIKRWNATTVEFDNGGKLTSLEASENAARSFTSKILIIDEHAFIKNWTKIWKGLYPVLTSSSAPKIILASTTNGRNHFFQFWTRAKKGLNGYIPHFVKWDDVKGRGKKWKKEILLELGNDSERIFLAEFENQFTSKSGTLIDTLKLDTLSNNFKEPYEIDKVPRIFIEELVEYTGNVRLYEPPLKDHKYFITADTSTLTGDVDTTGDQTSLHVFDITTLPFKQVAAVHLLDEVSYLEVPSIIFGLTKIYNDPWVGIENNDGAGREILYILQKEFRYDKLTYEYNDKGKEKIIKGMRTTIYTKKHACKILKKFIEYDLLEIVDFETIEQLNEFVRKDNSWKADSGYDDAVTSMLQLMIPLIAKNGQPLYEQIFEETDLPNESQDFIKLVYTNLIKLKEYIKENSELRKNAINKIISNKYDDEILEKSEDIFNKINAGFSKKKEIDIFEYIGLEEEWYNKFQDF